jgi:sugar phosphate isomerase/epimerase
MTISFSLAHLTVIGLSPPEVVRVAARTGYRTVGLRLIRVTETSPGYALMRDPKMMSATKSAMAETNVGVLDIELVQITPDIDVAGLEPFLAAGAELNARFVITAPYDPDLTRLADRLAAIDGLGVRYGLQAVLEFFPWTVVPNLDAAINVVNAAGRPRLGILVDTLHFDRSGSSVVQPRGRPLRVYPSRMSPTPPCRRVTQRKNCFTLAARSGCPPGRARSTSEESSNICPMEFRSRSKYL